MLHLKSWKPFGKLGAPTTVPETAVPNIAAPSTVLAKGSPAVQNPYSIAVKYCIAAELGFESAATSWAALGAELVACTGGKKKIGKSAVKFITTHGAKGMLSDTAEQRAASIVAILQSR